MMDDDAPYGIGLLEGYAGTGKTYLVGELVAYWLAEGYTVAITAPTNKAVRVLKEKVEARCRRDAYRLDRDSDSVLALTYGSIHSFLGLKMNERDDGSQECRQERDPVLHRYDLVVVDECSMIDDHLFSQITLSRRQARILFIGDPAQLPPVGNDTNQVSQVFQRITYRAILTDVVRQALDNPIIRLSIAIRQAMEQGDKISLQTLAAALPAVLPAKAGIVPGGRATAVNAALYEIARGNDARVIAFTNSTVMAYNATLHEALHGPTRHPFVEGEAVIAHQQFEVARVDDQGAPIGQDVVITSEECRVVAVEAMPHFIYREQYPCCRVTLLRDSGARVACFVADDRAAIDRDISQAFQQWRQLSLAAKAATDPNEAHKLRTDAKGHSGHAWGLRKAFAPLRHAYALTTHKSQGSTFDTAIVDYNDLSRMRSAFAFNRALYVAATRAAENLAVVV
jgi:exodeoxyribonuclease-5